MRRRAFLALMLGLPAGVGSVRGAGFEPVLPGRRLVFPADHGAHPAFRNEWWYATGWLEQADGQPLGFQITFFRVRTGIGEHSDSAFAPRQLMLAHAAIADPALGRLRHDQRAARAGFGRAGFDIVRTHAWLDDWRLEQRAARYVATVRSKTFAYDLELVPGSPPMLNGYAGFSTKAADARHASYYYSRPQLAVSGEASLDGRARRVTGQAWLDHEWSSELMPAGAQGWDWIGINLLDGGALMAFRMRDQRHRALWAAASLRSAAGDTRSLTPRAVNFQPLRHWRSPRSGINYPVAWRVRLEDRVFVVEPLFDDQELDSRLSTGAIYWEGAVRVRENQQEIGRGYLEMTGYGERIRMD